MNIQSQGYEDVLRGLALQLHTYGFRVYFNKLSEEQLKACKNILNIDNLKYLEEVSKKIKTDERYMKDLNDSIAKVKTLLKSE